MYNYAKKTGIARRLIIYMVLFSSFITLLITIIQLTWDYKKNIDYIEEQLQQINDVHLDSLTNNLWVSDIEELKVHLEGVLQLQDIHFLEIKDQTKIWLSVGNENVDRVIIKKYPMIKLSRNTKVRIGTLTVYSSLSDVYQRLVDKVWVIIASNGIQTILVAIFMLVFFYRVNTRHLVKIANFTREMNTVNFNTKLQLDRDNENSKDELSLVVDAINKMQLNIKNSFDALKQSEERFHVLAKFSPVGIFQTNAEGVCTYANDSWCNLAGLTKDEAIKNNWTDSIFYEDRKKVNDRWSESILMSKKFKAECRIKMQGNKINWLFIQSEPVFDVDNSLSGFVGAVTDVTERKRMENVLKLLAASSTGLSFDLFLSDSLKTLIDLFQCRYAYIGQLLTDGDTVRTISFQTSKSSIDNFEFSLIDTPCEDVYKKSRNLVIKNAKSLYPNDHILIDMNVDSYFGIKLSTSNGSMIGILAIMDAKEIKYEQWMDPVISLFAARMSLELESEKASQDLLQQQIHLEELVDMRTSELLTALDHAKHANAAKSDFVSHMSHELRTPMNAILGFAQILELDCAGFDETQQQNVKEIIYAGKHLLDLINDVLDLAKIESGKLPVSIKSVVLADVINQSLTIIKPEADLLKIRINNSTIDQDYMVLADFTRLKQVLLNLLSNAVKYNCEHGEIDVQCKVLNSNRLRVSISDTGRGLSNESISKLFTSFERLDAINNVEGTGIGLVITKHLIELMGGTIGVSSIENKGTIFWIELLMPDIQ